MTLRHAMFHVAIAAMAIAHGTTAAKDVDPPLELAPTTGWQADFADESCALRRNFGDGKDEVSLEFRQFSPGVWFQVAVASPTLGMWVRSPQSYFLPDQPEDKPVEVLFNQGVTTSDGGKGLIVVSSLLTHENRATARSFEDTYVWADVDRDRREREVTGFFLARAFKRDLVLRTGAMHEPMKVMRTCLDDLLSRWGLDPEAHRSIAQKVKMNASQSLWRRLSGLLPRNAGDVAVIRGRLLIDEAGQLTGCTVLEGALPGERVDEFCQVVRKEAKFEPALDRNSQPMKSFYIVDFARVRRLSY